MTNAQAIQNVGKIMTLYVTGAFIVLVTLVIFWPIGLVVLVTWLWAINTHRRHERERAAAAIAAANPWNLERMR